MSSDVFDDLKNYYVSLAKELTSQASQAGLLKNPTGIGTEREEVYLTFLKRHLPKMCDIFLGGYVFDLQGNKSSQIDVIVTGGNIPRFRMATGERFLAPLEGTVAVAEVKSKLDKANLLEALHGCATIAPMPEPSGIISPLLKVPRAQWDDIPYKIILAFDAVDKETLYQHITAFYDEHDNIPINRRPNLIHVVGKYFLIRFPPNAQVVNSDGTIPPEKPEVDQYRCFDTGPDAIAIAWTLDAICTNAFIAQNSRFKYQSWINEIAQRIRKESNPTPGQKKAR